MGTFTGGVVPIKGLVIRNLTLSGEMATHSRSPMCCFNVTGVATGVTPTSALCKTLRPALKLDDAPHPPSTFVLLEEFVNPKW